ncbi:hypothetical protein KC614_03305 [candidate division WWE3 bacterium]|uniref:DUF3899 domain-containing protein n=1 Tax=candidate division WWE3 bacterium TaxID=2053526 RepID=A0A955RS80_UNCKA|nr:hypothetical protein [candidate division WWE3 bacterium]
MAEPVLITIIAGILLKNSVRQWFKTNDISTAIKNTIGISLFELFYVSALFIAGNLLLSNVLNAVTKSKLASEFVPLVLYFVSYFIYLYFDRTGAIDKELNKTKKDGGMYQHRPELKNSLVVTGLKEALFVGIIYVAASFTVFVVAIVASSLI